MITVHKASQITGIPSSKLRYHLRQGNLAGERQGWNWVVNENSLINFVANRPKRGWPSGVTRCARCGGADVSGHTCPE